MAAETADIIVIGAGMAGASAAAHLAENARVILIEGEDQPGYHSTGRSAALFSETYGNLAIRTLAVSLLLVAVMNFFWGQGQPFAFPRFLPTASVSVGGVRLSLVSLVTVVVAVLLGAGFWLFYSRTRPGLLLRGIADRPDIARLLGANIRGLSGLAWLMAGLVAVVVGLLTVPSALLSTDMMDSFLLFAFTAALLGGITSLPGAFVGGVVVGVISNVVSVLRGQEFSIIAIFALLILTLLVRPNGLFGHEVAERL